jgi:hypothetical protein
VVTHFNNRIGMVFIIFHSPELGTFAEFIDATYVRTFFFKVLAHTVTSCLFGNSRYLVTCIETGKVAAVDMPKLISEPESVLL